VFANFVSNEINRVDFDTEPLELIYSPEKHHTWMKFDRVMQSIAATVLAGLAAVNMVLVLQKLKD
jgi:hypothetical protein